MLIKKVEKDEDGIEKSLYDSSNVIASEYDKNTKTLTVIFNGGRKYKYKNVDETSYTRFNIAESQGKELNAEIKPNYDYERLNDVEVEAYKSELEKELKSEIWQLEKELYETMKGLIEYHDANLPMDRMELDNVIQKIQRIKEFEQKN